MKSQNTAIIGAGITGLYLAQKLSEQGHKVTLFEKRSEIGKMACSGLFSEEVLAFFPESESLVENRITSVVVHFPKKTVRVRFKTPFLVMSHAELDRLAAKKAEASGVRILLNKHIEDLPREFDKIIGCDGANSAVRQALNLKPPSFRLGILGFFDKKDNTDFVETWAVKNGFIWRIPRGERTEYGILSGIVEAKAIFESFLKKENVKLSEIKSGLVPQGLVFAKNDSVTLCGDAVGLTKPWSGGGVVFGLTSAQILVDSFPDFKEYRKRLKKRFKLKIIVLKIFTQVVYFLGFNFPRILPKNIKIENDAIFPNFIKFTENH
ncbi:MAG: FAD-dependent oxidoreductase [Candidatus Nealsonbacteria bacterium]